MKKIKDYLFPFLSIFLWVAVIVFARFALALVPYNLLFSEFVASIVFWLLNALVIFIMFSFSVKRLNWKYAAAILISAVLSLGLGPMD